MLLGDPVAYFTDGAGSRSTPSRRAGADYYFASGEHREVFQRPPGMSRTAVLPTARRTRWLGSDPTQFEIRDGRLFIFGDVLGREMWLLDPAGNIAHGDQLWPTIADSGWRAQSLKAWMFKVPWYRTGPSLMAEWQAKHPGRTIDYDTGGAINNLVFKYPGWRAREGYSQPALGVPGEWDDKP